MLNLQIGFMLKRGVGGTGRRQAQKRFFEFFDKDEIDETKAEHEAEREADSMIVEFDEFNKYTRSIRMELYVSFEFWNKHLRGSKGRPLLLQLTALAYLAEAHMKQKFEAYNKKALKVWLRAHAANLAQKKRMSDASIKATLRNLHEAEVRLDAQKETLSVSCNRLESLTKNLSVSDLCGSRGSESAVGTEVEKVVSSLVDKVVLRSLDEARNAVVQELNQFQVDKKLYQDTKAFADKLQVQSVVENLVDTVSSYHVRQWFRQHSDTTLMSIYSAPPRHLPKAAPRDLQYPLYLIATRDCFSCLVFGIPRGFDMKQFNADTYDFAQPILTFKGAATPTCIDWYFHEAYGVPPACRYYYGKKDERQIAAVDGMSLYPVGVSTYTTAFSEEEMRTIEDETMSVYFLLNKNSQFRDNTADHTVKASRCVRTKMFFEYRYLWSSQQMRAKVRYALYRVV